MGSPMSQLTIGIPWVALTTMGVAVSHRGGARISRGGILQGEPRGDHHHDLATRAPDVIASNSVPAAAAC